MTETHLCDHHQRGPYLVPIGKLIESLRKAAEDSPAGMETLVGFSMAVGQNAAEAQMFADVRLGVFPQPDLPGGKAAAFVLYVPEMAELMVGFKSSPGRTRPNRGERRRRP